MKNYLKLVNFELNRFIKIYASLVAITVISQLTGVYVLSKQYLARAHETMYEQSITAAQYVYDWGEMSFHYITGTLWVMGPIALGMVALLFYIFLIWYRDWYGKNAFIYRLLMLPTSRLNVYLAKATSIFLMTLGLVAIQLILLPIGSQILKWTVPIELRMDMTIQEIIGTFNYLAILFPNTFTDFAIHYAIGFMSVFILFTAILFERSYKLKGIIFGGLYVVFAVCLFLLPMIITVIRERLFLYPMEYFIIEVVLGLVVIAMSIWISHYLLRKKVTV